MWSIMVFIGLLAAVVIYRKLSAPLKIADDAFFNFGIILLVSVGAGFLFAFLFQALYEVIAYGKAGFKGVTFMGGLVGGIAVFYIACMTKVKGESRKQIWNLTCLAPVAITAAHGFGRLGCFFAGCCHGKETDSFIGMLFPGDKHKVIPTQLIEALFLFALCAILLVLILKYRRYGLTMIVYLFAYAVFRFIIEFYRGDTARAVKGSLSPSQWQSIFMFLCATALTIYIFVLKRIPFNGKQEGDLTKYLFEKE